MLTIFWTIVMWIFGAAVALMLLYLIFKIVKFTIKFLYLLSAVKIEKELINKKYNAKCIETEQIVNKCLAYIILIFGKIRAGKTTLMMGLKHIFEKSIIDRLKRSREQKQVLMPELNFSHIDGTIEANQQLDLKALVEMISNQNMHCVDKDLPNALDVKIGSYSEMLTSYIEDTQMLLNNNYVMSNIEIYSRVTNKWGKEFDPEWLELKNAYEKSEFPLRKNLVICIDEATKDSNKVASNHNAVKKVDPGTDLAFQFFGQLFEETNRLISTMQNIEKYIKNERRLATNFIVAKSTEVVGFRNRSKELLDIFKSINKKMLTIRIKFMKKELREHYLNNNNFFKRNEKKLTEKINNLMSEAFLKIETKFYDDLNEAETESLLHTKHTLYFPIKYCRGVYDTHNFKFIAQIFEKITILKYSDIQCWHQNEKSQSEFNQFEKMMKKSKDIGEEEKEGERTNKKTNEKKIRKSNEDFVDIEDIESDL